MLLVNHGILRFCPLCCQLPEGNNYADLLNLEHLIYAYAYPRFPLTANYDQGNISLTYAA